MTGKQVCKASLLFTALLMVLVSTGSAQINNQTSQQFRLGAGIIRIAEPGQLADSVNVWGDVPNTGRFLIPQQTTIPQLMSYAGGPRGLESDLFNISKVKIIVNISRYMGVGESESKISNFEFAYQDPIPAALYHYNLRNNDVVSIEVRRRPNFLDYLKVIGPIITTITSILILSNRL